MQNEFLLWADACRAAFIHTGPNAKSRGNFRWEDNKRPGRFWPKPSGPSTEGMCLGETLNVLAKFLRPKRMGLCKDHAPRLLAISQHQVGPERIELTGVEFAAPPCAIATLLARPCGLSPQASTLCAGRLFPASPRIPLHALPNSSRYQLLSSLGCISVPRGAPLLTRCAL